MKIQDVKIDKEIVLKFLGYKNRKVPKYIEKVIDEEINSSFPSFLKIIVD